MTDPLGQSQVLPYLRGLAANGYNIHILSFEKRTRYTADKDRILEICKTAGITWHPLQYTKNPPVLSSILDYRKMCRLSDKLQRQHRFAMVHCRSYLPGMAGLRMKKKYGIPFIFDIRGFWADERVEGGLWNLKNPVYRSIYHYFKRREKELFLQADAIVSLTHKAEPVIRKIQNQTNASPAVIPCCVDTELFNPAKITNESKNELRKRLGIPENAFVLSYLGGIGTWYKADEMFDFFKRLLLFNPEAYFLFITQEPERELKLKAISRNIPAERIIVQPARRNEVPEFLSIADMSLFFIMDTFSKSASSPTKQGEVMSMGLPVICNDNVGDSADILRENNTGYICTAFNNDEYDRIIHQLKFPVLPSEKEYIRKVAIKNFSLEDGIQSYLKLYRKIIS
jgi:glycosyltransferase involved in cell wall biosynthesis